MYLRVGNLLWNRQHTHGQKRVLKNILKTFILMVMIEILNIQIKEFPNVKRM